MSSSELTDKEIYQIANKFSLGCPNCGGRLATMASEYTASDAFREELSRHVRNGDLSLLPVEEVAETMKEDRGRTLNPTVRAWLGSK